MSVTRAQPTIVCAGMCNTKGPEIRHLAAAVAEHGGRPVVMDLSLGEAVDWADIPLPEVLATTGTSVEAVFAAPRAAAIELVGRAAAAKVVQLHAAGRLDGIISWAGSVGTSTATWAMRALPFGVPKIMLTDMAPSDVSLWLGNKDIYIVNPTAEHGINVVTRKAIANAAAAIVAMAKVPEMPPGSRPLCAITSYGSTTPAVLRCTTFMERRGWDTASFHAVGAGATMEDLIRSGLITAVIDLTTGELMNDLFGSVYGPSRTWSGERLTAASAMGIPQVVLPGGLDQAAYGPLDSVPRRYLEDIAAGRRRGYHDTGMPYQHNDSVTILPPTPAEVDRVSRYMAEKLSATKGPTCLILPMQGWSAYDQREALATRERGWAAGNGDGPTWDADPDRPTWSRRATRMRAVFAECLDRSNSNLDLIVLDRHILDAEVTDLVDRCMGDMLEGAWRPGLYGNTPGILPDGPDRG